MGQGSHGQAVEMGGFLRSRRERLTAREAGVPEYGRRRVPGLRREELAALAGVSVSYDTRIEQGQAGVASAAVLDALAEALRLPPDDRVHLRRLAEPVRPELWDEHPVGEGPVGPARLRHPLLGEVVVRDEVLRSTRDTRQLLVTFHPLPGSQEALRRLAEHLQAAPG